jgi:hypothetical protein
VRHSRMGTHALKARQHHGVRHHMKRTPAAGSQPASTDVTASEIACYAYCAKAWHLEHVQHVAPDDTSRRREIGVAAHEAHGARVRALGQGRSRTRVIAAALLLLAALAAIGAVLLP